MASDGHAYIDEDGNLLTEEDHGYGDEKYYVEWSPDVYYCIPEDGSGPTPEPTGSTISIDTEDNALINCEVSEDEHALILD